MYAFSILVRHGTAQYLLTEKLSEPYPSMAASMRVSQGVSKVRGSHFLPSSFKSVAMWKNRRDLFVLRNRWMSCKSASAAVSSLVASVEPSVILFDSSERRSCWVMKLFASTIGSVTQCKQQNQKCKFLGSLKHGHKTLQTLRID